MINPGLLTKLKQEKKLEIVESSEEIKESYFIKSERSLGAAKLLLQNEYIEESVSSSYYSMYNLLTALLFKTGIKCENHAASISLLKEIFNFDNYEIYSAKIERIDKQYYVNFHLVKKDAENMILIAEKFNKRLYDFVSRINGDKIKEYQTKFALLFNSLRIYP